MTCAQYKTQYHDMYGASVYGTRHKTFFGVSAHGDKEDRYVNGRHVRLVTWSFMGHLRARDVLIDGMVDHSRVEELV
jgi:hypothetical protein